MKLSLLVNSAVSAVVVVVMSASLSTHAATFVSWSPVTGSVGNYQASGTLGTVSALFTNDSNNVNFAPSITTSSYSDSAIFSPPGSSSESTLISYNGDGTDPPAYLNTVTFSSDIQDLALYFKFWRGGSSLSGVATYQLNAFDSGNNPVSYSFLSGNYASVPTIANNQFDLGDTNQFFTSGVIGFNGSVSKVEWTITDPNTMGGNGLTAFAVVPEPSTFGLAAIGVAGAGLAFRRRKVARRKGHAPSAS